MRTMQNPVGWVGGGQAGGQRQCGCTKSDDCVRIVLSTPGVERLLWHSAGAALITLASMSLEGLSHHTKPSVQAGHVQHSLCSQTSSNLVLSHIIAARLSARQLILQC